MTDVERMERVARAQEMLNMAARLIAEAETPMLSKTGRGMLNLSMILIAEAKKLLLPRVGDVHVAF
jgi:hypothetical protein